jgi:hypothetical protein
MLIYLDSAHFDYLERASSAEVARLQSALARDGCELAVSLHHLQEMAQLADTASTMRRLRVLGLFPIVRFGQATSELALRFEVQVEIIKSLGFNVDLQRSAVDTLFPISSFSEIERAIVNAEPFLRSMRVPLEMSASASNLTKGQKRVSLRRRVPPDEPTRLRARELALEAVQDQPPQVADMVLELFARVESEVLSAGDIRSALENMYELETVAIRSRILDADLASIAVFFQTARGQVADIAAKLGIDRDLVSQAVEYLDPYECPGFALQLAVRRARDAHTKPDEPGDEIDLTHIAFAPYVTLLLADKRTHTFIHQEMRRPDGRLDPKFTGNVMRVGSLSQLAEQIASFGGAV